MKRIFIFLCLLILLCGCDDRGTSKLPNLGDSQIQNEYDRSSETLPLVTAKNGFASGGYLYFIDNGWLSFTILKTGQTQVMCFDPLCSHDTITSETTCSALSNVNSYESRVLVHDGKVWFTAEVMPQKYGDPKYIQLRSLDLDTMESEVYLKKNELSITDFWIYGDDIYLTMPTVKEAKDGGIYYSGGSIYRLDKNDKLTLIIEDTDDRQLQLISSDKGYLYYSGKFGDGTIYKTTSDFSHTEAIAVLTNVYNVRFYDGYVYYQRRTEKEQSAECSTVDGDFDKNISIMNYTCREVALYRRKLDGTDTEETVYTSMPIPRSNYILNYRNYYIDTETGLIYLVPLEVVCKGYTTWKPDSTMIKMGASGKDILTGYFSISNGRLIVMDSEALKIVREYNDLYADVLDIYGIENGQLMGKLTSIDPAVLDEKGTGSNKIYEYSGMIDLN